MFFKNKKKIEDLEWTIKSLQKENDELQRNLEKKLEKTFKRKIQSIEFENEDLSIYVKGALVDGDYEVISELIEDGHGNVIKEHIDIFKII